MPKKPDLVYGKVVGFKSRNFSTWRFMLICPTRDLDGEWWTVPLDYVKTDILVRVREVMMTDV